MIHLSNICCDVQNFNLLVVRGDDFASKDMVSLVFDEISILLNHFAPCRSPVLPQSELLKSKAVTCMFVLW